MADRPPVTRPPDPPAPCLYSLDHNHLCSDYVSNSDSDTDDYSDTAEEGITALCDALKGSVITSLRCAFTPRVFAFPSMPTNKKANTLWQPITCTTLTSPAPVTQRWLQRHHG